MNIIQKTLPVTTEEKNPAHILVVDDEPEIGESLSEFLSRHEGYRVTRAANGQEALDILEATVRKTLPTIDLVLLDVRMPVMSGPEVLHWIRNHSELQYTRVVMLTAATGNEEKVEALSAGADDYITKPYYPQELLARVKTILRTQLLEKQLQRQSQQLASLNRITRSIAGKLTTRQILELAVEAVDAVIGVELAAVFMAGDDKERLYCRKVHAPNDKISENSFSTISSGEGVVGLAYLQEKALCLNETMAESYFQSGIDAPEGFPIRSIMAAPLFVRGQTVGVLSALNKRFGLFSEIDRRLFSSLASSISRAIEVSWLFQNVRQRQQELLESRNTLQAVIDGILHPIYTIDEEWRLVSVNQTKAENLDKSSGNLAGKLCYEAFFNRNRPCEHCDANLTLAREEPKRWSVSWLGDDHRPEEFDISAFPIPGTKKESAQAVIVWLDRTEERRLESSLMQAGKLAAIGQLAAGVAHEINNPLTAISANAQMLQIGRTPENEDYESLDLIIQASDRAAKVVRSLLDFARQTEYEFAGADINESIQQALSLVSYQFTVAKVEIIANLADKLPEVKASWEHLQSVWLNLMINARDALIEKEGQRRIDISTRFEDVKDQIVVMIRDNGPGMTAAEINRIFDPFYTTKDPGKGTGLGLATCHRIVEQHGGQIDVDSTPGSGTVFSVRLPVNGEHASIG